jgi:hypothetical protein
MGAWLPVLVAPYPGAPKEEFERYERALVEQDREMKIAFRLTVGSFAVMFVALGVTALWLFA